MKKSNWIVYGIAFAASIVFLAIWSAMGFNKVHMLEPALAVIWWIVIVGSIVAVKQVSSSRSKRRSSSSRRMRY